MSSVYPIKTPETAATPTYFAQIVDNGGDTPRVRSQIKYKIVIDFGGKIGSVEYNDVQTTWKYPPETIDGAPLECIPREKGFGFLVSVQAPGLPAVLHFHEMPAMSECTDPGGGSGGLRIRRRGTKPAPSETTGGQAISGPTAGGITR